MTTERELLAAMSKNARYEVRVLESERVATLVLYQDEVPVAALALNDEQAHQLSVTLVQAAERIGALAR